MIQGKPMRQFGSLRGLAAVLGLAAAALALSATGAAAMPACGTPGQPCDGQRPALARGHAHASGYHRHLGGGHRRPGFLPVYRHDPHVHPTHHVPIQVQDRQHYESWRALQRRRGAAFGHCHNHAGVEVKCSRRAD